MSSSIWLRINTIAFMVGLNSVIAEFLPEYLLLKPANFTDSTIKGTLVLFIFQRFDQQE